MTGPPMTLCNAAAAKVRLIASCRACGHQAEPHVDTLVKALGADFPVPEWMARLRCSKCGSLQYDKPINESPNARKLRGD